MDEQNNLVGEGDAFAQTTYILEKIQKVLESAGAALQDVVRTRMFVTDISRWQECGKAHGTFFGAIRPCTSMIEVSRLIHNGSLIEIEATAILQHEY